MELSTWNFQWFLLQNVVFGFKLTGLRMRGVSRKVLLLSFLLFFVNPCVPERAEREKSLALRERDDDGRDVNHNTPDANQQTLIKHAKEDGLSSNDPQKNGQSVRFEPTNIDFSTLPLE